jgi:hypothetical protein
MPVQRQTKDRIVDASTVISLLPVPLDETKPGLIPSQFIIPAVHDPMRELATLTVLRARFPVYLDENRPALVVPCPSDILAESICQDYKSSVSHYNPGVSEPGLFWVRGDFTEDQIKELFITELNTARRLQIEWFKALVSEADDDWEKTHLRKAISSVQRLACKALGLERDWNLDAAVEDVMKVTVKPCTFCRSEIHVEAIVCPFCRAILDKDKFKAGQGQLVE